MKGNILVVDDERDMATLLKRTLEPELGCTITTVFSGEMALTVLAKESFDLVLCDIRMPGMDGFQLLDHVGEHFPGLTMVMITAFGSIDVAITAIKKGAYDFISKPFEQDEIIFRVKKALERSLLLKENQKLQNEKKGRTIELPPLRDRITDIPSIAQHLVTKHCKKLNRPEKKFPQSS
jgi:DNA-binding NtrC family response regulator